MESRTLLSIMVSTFDDTVAADGVTSLREAIAQAAANPGADAIVLPRSIGSVEGTYALALGELAIDDGDPLTIESDGGLATIDAQGASRVFSIAAGSDVALQGLVITGGSLPDPDTGSGGGVANDGILSVDDCTFSGNFAGFIGGGLYNSASATATVTDSTFEGNSSTYGGGFNNQGTATVTGGVFRDNSASGNGGGIESIGTVTIIGTLVEQNTANEWGGGIHSYGGFEGFPGTLTVDGATVRHNTAHYGGGISFEDGSASVSGATVTGNTATNGGGIYERNSTSSVTGTTVDNNVAGYIGGGFYIDSGSTATIDGSTFETNRASYEGGGIYSYSASVAIDGGVFHGNTASLGGGVFNTGGVLNIRTALFSENSADYYGGGVRNDYAGTATIENTSFEKNSATGGGGFMNYSGTATVTGNTFINNSALYDGGGVDNRYGIAVISDNTFVGNTGPSSAGLFDLSDYSSIIDNVFDGNQGNGLLLGGYSTLVQGNTIVNNGGDGVQIYNGYYIRVGTPEAGNVITGNADAGVSIVSFGVGNSIRGNVINSNAGLAIDLGGDGRTLNDPGDLDSGPNYLLNYPVITDFATGATTHVTGTLSSGTDPNTLFTIDFYSDQGIAPLNPGESTRYLGSFQVTTDALGNASFNVTLAAATVPGEIVTATATDPYGSTSEFSDLNFIKVTPALGLSTSESGAKGSFSVVLTSPPSARVTIPLRSSDTTEGSVRPASLTFTPNSWNVPQVVTVSGVDDSISDGAIPYVIVTGPATSADPVFNGMDGDDVQVTNFDNDFAPFAAIQPTGSLIYDASLEGAIVPGGNVEIYSIRVDPGQKITVIVEPEGTDLKAKVQLFRDSDSLGRTTAGAAGQDAVLQTIATHGQLGAEGPGPKTYKIKVSGAGGTTGRYRVRVILNAAAEDECHDGARNDTRGAAQNLDPSFLPLNGPVNDPPKNSVAARGAVLGRADGFSPDYYAISLAKGESVTTALTALTYGELTLSLEDASGTVLAVGRGGVPNLSQVIENFMATKKGTYYLRINSGYYEATDYSLVVTRNADFDTEANDSFSEAQDLIASEVDGRRWVMGAIEPVDTYVASAQTYTFEDISATGQAILQGSDDGSQSLSAAELAGFRFTFFGVESESIDISANGYLYLPGGFGAYIFAMNRDLVIFGAPDAAVYWQVLGTGDQQRLVVQWNDVGFFGYDGADPITFQAVLSEADGSVQFNYLDLHTDVSGFDEGLYSTVGISGSYPDGTYSTIYLPTNDAPNQYVGTGRSSRIAQPPGTDSYRITVDSNSTVVIETQTPAPGGGEFANALDPIIRLYDSAGNLVASDDNGASDGRNARLTYKVPKKQGGTYYIQVDASPGTPSPTQGEYLLSVKKATGDLPAFRVTGTDIPDGTPLRDPPWSIQVDFDDVLLLTTLQASDLTVDGLPATGFTVVDGDTVRFDLPTTLPDGNHTVTIAADAIRDVQGTKVAAFTQHFTTDTTPPRVIGSSIQQGDILLPGDLTYTVTFSEPMNTAFLDPYDFSLRGEFGGAFYATSYSFDAAGTTLTLSYSGLAEDNYSLVLLSGDYQFEDLLGNNLDGEVTTWPIPPNPSGDGVEGGDFSVSFSMDVETLAFPTPLIPSPPAGSLVYQQSLSGIVNTADDTDSYTIALDPGQTLTVFAYGPSGLQPSIEVRDPSGTLLGSAQASGQVAILQSVAINTAGTYTITMGGASGTAGPYALSLILNAAAESDATNDSVADAQNIDGSFIDLINGATRGAVVGLAGDTDVYAFQLQAGRALSADLVFHDTSPPQILGSRVDLYEYAPISVTLGDVNNDGKLDMVDASAYGGYLSVRLGNGDGTFGDPSAFGFGAYNYREIVLADLNGDGNLDAATTDYFGARSGVGGVLVMLGRGDGTFDDAAGYITGLDYFEGLALGDVNGDGASDILATSPNASTVHVLLNNGNGTFGSDTSYSVGAGPTGVAMGDFNSDGALDLVTSNFDDFSNNSVTVLLNNGDGTFSPGIPYFAGYYAARIAVGDLNGDGSPDIALTNYNDQSMSILLNNGDGTFASAVPYVIPGFYITSVAIGDVNGDGAADIAVGSGYNSSYTAGNVTLLLNDGDGTFHFGQNFDSGYYTNAVALGDLNGDSRPDVVTANLYGDSLSVFLNQSQPTLLELLAPDGVTVLASAEATDNVQAAFSNLIAPDTGTYYLRVTGPPTIRFYTLVATRDASFDLGGNDSTATAQPLGPVRVALGHVGVPGDSSDFYSFSAAAGEVVHLFTTTPGDGAGEFNNTLNPHLRLFDSLGTLLSEGVPSADGRNEQIDFTADDAGAYFVEFFAEDGTSGEYLLDLSAVESAGAISTNRSETEIGPIPLRSIGDLSFFDIASSSSVPFTDPRTTSRPASVSPDLAAGAIIGSKDAQQRKAAPLSVPARPMPSFLRRPATRSRGRVSTRHFSSNLVSGPLADSGDIHEDEVLFSGSSNLGKFREEPALLDEALESITQEEYLADLT